MCLNTVSIPLRLWKTACPTVLVVMWWWFVGQMSRQFHTTAQAALKLTASQHPEYIRGMRCYACPNFILLFIIFCMNYKWRGFYAHIHMWVHAGGRHLNLLLSL